SGEAGGGVWVMAHCSRGPVSIRVDRLVVLLWERLQPRAFRATSGRTRSSRLKPLGQECVPANKNGPVLGRARRVKHACRQTRLPRSSDTTARIRNTTNRIHATLLAAPAMPEKPSTAA